MFKHWLVLALIALALVFPTSRRILIETIRNVFRPIIAVLFLIAVRLP
ncbi:MAG: hypothetical protein ACP5P4_16410 [Steroidobacteraceae bacterium]